MIKKRDNIRLRMHFCLDGQYYGGGHIDRFRNVVKAYHMLGGWIKWVEVVHPDWIKQLDDGLGTIIVNPMGVPNGKDCI